MVSSHLHLPVLKDITLLHFQPVLINPDSRVYRPDLALFIYKFKFILMVYCSQDQIFLIHHSIGLVVDSLISSEVKTKFDNQFSNLFLAHSKVVSDCEILVLVNRLFPI